MKAKKISICSLCSHGGREDPRWRRRIFPAVWIFLRDLPIPDFSLLKHLFCHHPLEVFDVNKVGGFSFLFSSVVHLLYISLVRVHISFAFICCTAARIFTVLVHSFLPLIECQPKEKEVCIVFVTRFRQLNKTM